MHACMMNDAEALTTPACLHGGVLCMREMGEREGKRKREDRQADFRGRQPPQVPSCLTHRVVHQLQALHGARAGLGAGAAQRVLAVHARLDAPRVRVRVELLDLVVRPACNACMHCMEGRMHGMLGRMERCATSCAAGHPNRCAFERPHAEQHDMSYQLLDEPPVPLAHRPDVALKQGREERGFCDAMWYHIM